MTSAPEEDLESSETADQVPPLLSTRQFGMRDLGLATLLVALLCGVTRFLPWSSQHVWFYIAYFGLLFLYTALRVPAIARAVRHDRQRMQIHKEAVLREARHGRDPR